MPLKNTKHEIFAQEVAKGATRENAYLEAYPNCSPTSANKNASRLMANDGILRRIEEIQGESAERAKITITDLIDMARTAYEKARAERGGASAMVNAVREIGVLSGLRVEKSARTNTNYDATQLSDDELAAIIKNEGG